MKMKQSDMLEVTRSRLLMVVIRQMDNEESNWSLVAVVFGIGLDGVVWGCFVLVVYPRLIVVVEDVVSGQGYCLLLEQVLVVVKQELPVRSSHGKVPALVRSKHEKLPTVVPAPP